MKSVVVVGCPYSGTKHMSMVLEFIGLDITHEVVKPDGIVSWQHTHWSRERFLAQGVCEPAVYFHQVRHPLMAISAFVTLPYAAWCWLSDYLKSINHPWQPCEQDILLRSMRLWYYWNTLAEKMADYTYAIENLPFRWAWFLATVGLPYQEYPPIIPYMNRHGKRPMKTWNDMYKVSTELTKDILLMSRRYGYTQVPINYLRDPFYKFEGRIHLFDEYMNELGL